MSPVSTASSHLVYDSLKACGIRLVSALPETWLVHLATDLALLENRFEFQRYLRRDSDPDPTR